MSVEAITWALSQQMERSSAKFVLVAMANCANGDMTCWPSIQYLAEATCQDRKTVMENIKRLKEGGYIEATDEHKGKTGQVLVYHLKSTEIGIVKQAQKRDRSENGTVPKTDEKSTENGQQEAQKRTETGPKTGHGTIKNHKETSGTKKTTGAAVVAEMTLAELIESGLSQETAVEFLAHRKRKDAKLTPLAWKGLVKQAGKAGYSLEDACLKVIERNWQSFDADFITPRPSASRPVQNAADDIFRRGGL